MFRYGCKVLTYEIILRGHESILHTNYIWQSTVFTKSTQSLRLVHKSGTKAVVICFLLPVMFHDLYLSVEGIKVIGFVLFA